MVSSRKRRRKLKKTLRNVLIALPIVLGIYLILFFGCRIKTVSYTSDLNQYNAMEVQDYLKAHKIQNTLWFWFRSLVGLEKGIDLFEGYSVSLSSPTKIKITAQEKQLCGSFVYGENDFFFDHSGEILKTEPCSYKDTKEGTKQLLNNSLNICRFEGVSFESANLYQTLDTTEAEGKETILNMVKAFDEMDIALEKVQEENGNQSTINVKKIVVSEQYEITMHVGKKLKVALGKDNQLKEKMEAFVDIYSSTKAQLTANAGTLQMQWIMSDGSYTFIKD